MLDPLCIVPDSPHLPPFLSLPKDKQKQNKSIRNMYRKLHKPKNRNQYKQSKMRPKISLCWPAIAGHGSFPAIRDPILRKVIIQWLLNCL